MTAHRRRRQALRMCIIRILVSERHLARVAELVDALDLGSSAARRESSSLFPRTTGLHVACHERAPPYLNRKLVCAAVIVGAGAFSGVQINTRRLVIVMA